MAYFAHIVSTEHSGSTAFGDANDYLRRNNTNIVGEKAKVATFFIKSRMHVVMQRLKPAVIKNDWLFFNLALASVLSRLLQHLHEKHSLLKLMNDLPACQIRCHSIPLDSIVFLALLLSLG